MEDDRDLRRLVRFALTNHGFEVTEAGNGEAGLRELAERDFDAIVLAQELPITTGYAVLEWIVANRPHLIPRVSFTIGSPRCQALNDLLAAWQIPVFPKPFSLEALAQAVTRIAKNGHLAGAERHFPSATLDVGP